MFDVRLTIITVALRIKNILDSAQQKHAFQLIVRAPKDTPSSSFASSLPSTSTTSGGFASSVGGNATSTSTLATQSGASSGGNGVGGASTSDTDNNATSTSMASSTTTTTSGSVFSHVGGLVLTLVARDEADKRAWIAALRGAINAYHKHKVCSQR